MTDQDNNGANDADGRAWEAQTIKIFGEDFTVDDVGDRESAKIECGKAHFEALAVGETPARYVVANKFADVLARVLG